MFNISWGRTKPFKSIEDDEDPKIYCDKILKGIKEKADHNKNESLGFFILVTAATLTAPLFITLGEGVFWGKVVPSILSLIAAGSTAWLQLRQPQRLWALYRTAQRELEDHRARHHHQIDEYSDESDRDKKLAENVANIAIELHYKWLPLVPTTEKIKGVESNSNPVKMEFGNEQ